MAHHKRKKQPSIRAGCKMCKPQKAVTGYKGLVQREVLGIGGGFGKIRADIHTRQDMRLGV